MTPDPAHADRVDELCRTRDLVAALPDVGGFVDRAALREVLRERIEALNWGAG